MGLGDASLFRPPRDLESPTAIHGSSRPRLPMLRNPPSLRVSFAPRVVAPPLGAVDAPSFAAPASSAPVKPGSWLGWNRPGVRPWVSPSPCRSRQIVPLMVKHPRWRSRTCEQPRARRSRRSGFLVQRSLSLRAGRMPSTVTDVHGGLSSPSNAGQLRLQMPLCACADLVVEGPAPYRRVHLVEGIEQMLWRKRLQIG